jgi:hypothetical protein
LVIAGAKTRQQITENTAASALPALTPDERTRALAIADTLGTPNWSREKALARRHDIHSNARTAA